MSNQVEKVDILSPVIMVTGLNAIASVVLEWAPPIRMVSVLVFLLFSPGGAYIQLLRLKDAVAIFTLSVALSLVLDTVVALILLYLNAWSPFWALLILVYLSLMGVILRLVGARAKKH